jgi:hypothetical protein
MTSPQEYRALAKECLRDAYAAQTPQEATAFYEMARTWLSAAAQGEIQSQPIAATEQHAATG